MVLTNFRQASTRVMLQIFKGEFCLSNYISCVSMLSQSPPEWGVHFWMKFHEKFCMVQNSGTMPCVFFFLKEEGDKFLEFLYSISKVHAVIAPYLGRLASASNCLMSAMNVFLMRPNTNSQWTALMDSETNMQTHALRNDGLLIDPHFKMNGPA